MSDDAKPGEGKLLEFRPRTKPDGKRVRVMTLGEVRDIGWTDAELLAGYAIRTVSENLGGGVAIVARQGREPRKRDPILIFAPDALREMDAALSSARYRLRKEQEDKFLAAATRTVEEEAVGSGATWQLVRAEHGKDVWWEVTRDGKTTYCGRGMFKNEKREETAREFRRLAFGPHACRIRPREMHDGHGNRWNEGERCRRRSRHEGAHRNRDGEEWSTWPMTTHYAPAKAGGRAGLALANTNDRSRG